MDRLWELDQTLFRQIHLGWHRDWLDPVFWVLSTSGLGSVQSLALLGLIWFVWRNRPQDRTPLALFIAFTIAGLINTAFLKNLVPRERPSLLADTIPQETFFHDSFPSGHTATSFGIAAMLLLLTIKGPRAWAGWLAMIWAALVGLSRIYRGVHWPSDVIAGALIGLAAACLVYLVFDPLFLKVWRVSTEENSAEKALSARG